MRSWIMELNFNQVSVSESEVDARLSRVFSIIFEQARIEENMYKAFPNFPKETIIITFDWLHLEFSA